MVTGVQTCALPICKSDHASRHTFSRSYGVSLPSSLTRVLSRALGYSPRPPESVCGTDAEALPSRLFLEVWNHSVFRDESLTSSPLGLVTSRLSLSRPMKSAYGLELEQPLSRRAILLRPRYGTSPQQCRNINLLAIAYAFRPLLRFRLTLGRFILPRETLGFRRPSF